MAERLGKSRMRTTKMGGTCDIVTIESRDGSEEFRAQGPAHKVTRVRRRGREDESGKECTGEANWPQRMRPRSQTQRLTC
nr:hypothetical protein CFP56_50357 [Quercus suber]